MMFIRRILALLLGATLIATSVAAAAAEPASVHESERKGAEQGRPNAIEPELFARISLDGGAEISFYRLMADSGNVKGIGVGQYVPADGADPSTVRELRGANPHEIFHALAEPRAAVPEVLREHHDNRFHTRPQGWARGLVDKPVYQMFSCATSEQTVTNALAATGLPHSYSELSKGPHNWPLWSVEDLNALFPSYKNGLGMATAGDVYYHVMLCKEDATFAYTSVNVKLDYTEMSGSTVLASGALHWTLDKPGDQMSFMSWPFDSDLSGTNVWFWLLTVGGVYYYDSLHIGSAWNY